MAKNEKLEKLSKKFGAAKSLIEDLDSLVSEIEEPLLPEIIHSTEVAVIDEDVFSTSMLKTDFLMIKQNLTSLISKGQRILDTAMQLDIGDLKASQLDALTNLQNSIANNLKLIMEVYKMISEIEKMRQKNSKFNTMETCNSAINTGTVNNFVFSGTPNDLQTLFDKHQNNK
jgi:hypothetical protein